MQNYRYEIIVFSDDWHGMPFSCKHLLKNFPNDIKIIWVETIGLRAPGFNIYDFKRAFQKLSGWMKKSQTEQKPVPENIILVDPFQIPYNHIKFVRNINKKRMIKTIDAVSPGTPGKKRIMLTTWPFLGSLIGDLHEDLSIYYRVDDFSEFPGVRKQTIINLENEIISRADMVVASAEKLTDLGDKKKNSKYLPHGVDFAHFANSTNGQQTENPLKDIKGPIIGFFGLMNSWLNFDLVLQVARKRPDLSFVFLGPSQMPESELPSADNIHFLGSVDYAKLPTYARSFDAALVPFKINKLTIAVNPLKLMEYFALGLPVITTPLPEVIKYNDLVYAGSELESFETAIDKALSETDQEIKKKRIELAKSFSWESKSKNLQNWIESALEEKVG